MEDRSEFGEAFRQAADPMQLMQRVADQAMELVAQADGGLIALWDEGEYLTYVCGAGRLVSHVGLKIRVDDSLSGQSVRSGLILRSDDTSTDPRVDADACRRLGVLSSLCVPLVREGQSFGVLNVSSSRRNAFDQQDSLILSDLAEFVSVVVAASAELDRVTKALLVGLSLPTNEVDLEADAHSGNVASRFVANVLSPHSTDHLDAHQRIERVLADEDFSMVFQPVVDLENGQAAGFEALSRFHPPPDRTPDKWFAEAHEVGLGVELELAAVRQALSQQAQLPGRATLAVNAGPRAIICPEMVTLLEHVDAGKVVVELTEHTEVTDYPCLIRALADIRQTGARLAIDDTGSGVSSLAHILKLAPEFIKLDRALTTGIDRDPVRRALAASLVSFAADTGSLIVAEGIENEEELRVLRNLGIRYGQGFHLGKPGPISALSSSPKLLA